MYCVSTQPSFLLGRTYNSIGYRKTRQARFSRLSAASGKNEESIQKMLFGWIPWLKKEEQAAEIEVPKISEPEQTPGGELQSHELSDLEEPIEPDQQLISEQKGPEVEVEVSPVEDQKAPSTTGESVSWEGQDAQDWETTQYQADPWGEPCLNCNTQASFGGARFFNRTAIDPWDQDSIACA